MFYVSNSFTIQTLKPAHTVQRDYIVGDKLVEVPMTGRELSANGFGKLLGKLLQKMFLLWIFHFHKILGYSYICI